MIANIEQETIDNVRRLRNHPSIAIWNGNNEVLIGWENWGWQRDLDDKQKVLVFGWYENIFNKTIPNVISAVDPDRFYWPTSPTSQAPGNYSFGDIHQWTVWAAKGDIELYNDYIGRFNSEYGMQGMIPMSSLKQFTTPSDLYNASFVMQIHERHPEGWPNLNHYMA